MVDRQIQVGGLYLAQAQLLRRTADPADRALGLQAGAFVRSMPQSDSQRLALARELTMADLPVQQRAAPTQSPWLREAADGP
jgi:hypothetical protein